MAINAATGFLLEPIKAGVDALVAITRLRQGPGKVVPKTVTSQDFPEEALKKIRAFITELGLDPTQFTCILRPSPYSPCAAMLSLKWDGIAVLAFDPAFAENIAIANPLTSEMKFVIAHEVGHHMRDDMGTGYYERLRTSSSLRLSAMGATGIALGLLTSCGVVPGYLALSAVAVATGAASDKITKDPVEFGADLWAARQSAEIQNGGVAYFENELRKNLELKNKILKRLEYLEKGATCLGKCVTKIVGLFTKSLVNNQGDNFLDAFYHPFPTARIRALQQLTPSHTDSAAAHPQAARSWPQ